MNARSLFLPLFFGGLAAAIWYFNNVMNTGAKLVFPLIAYVPGYVNIDAQADGTVKLFAAIALGSALWGLFGGLRRPPGLPPT